MKKNMYSRFHLLSTALFAAYLLLLSTLEAALPSGTMRIGYNSSQASRYSSAANIPRYQVMQLGEDFIPRSINDNLQIIGVRNYVEFLYHENGVTTRIAENMRHPRWMRINESGMIAALVDNSLASNELLIWTDPFEEPYRHDWQKDAFENYPIVRHAAWNDLGQILYQYTSRKSSLSNLPTGTQTITKFYDYFNDSETQLCTHMSEIHLDRSVSYEGTTIRPRGLNNYGQFVADVLVEDTYKEQWKPEVVTIRERYNTRSQEETLPFKPHDINDRGTIIGNTDDSPANLIIKDGFGTRVIAEGVEGLRDMEAEMSNPDDGLEEIILGERYWRRNTETDRYGRSNGRLSPDFFAGSVANLARFPKSWFNIEATCISANGAIAGTANFYYAGERIHRLVGWYLAPIKILPDWNRDGRINHKDRLLAAFGQPWRFWINDDDDAGLEARSSDDDLPHATQPDKDNDHVDGLRDIVDFFPLRIDIRDFLAGKDLDKVQLRMYQAESGLRFVYCSLSPDSLYKMHASVIESGCGPSFDLPLASAPTHPVTHGGVYLNKQFLQKILDNTGVLLFEGANPAELPLNIELTYDGEVVFKEEFPIVISPVRDMMRILNLRTAEGKFAEATEGPWGTALNEPLNLPDFWIQQLSEKESIPTLVHLHGFNWGGEEIPAAHAELFKRFFQSGSPARFIGVTWYSDEGTMDLFDTAFDYNENVINALITAPLLKSGLNNFANGQLTLLGHSLGTMLAASAVAEHGLETKNLFLVNGAIPMEAFTGRPFDWRKMVHPNWKRTTSNGLDYAEHLYAANWSNLFPTHDYRADLTWQDRFAQLPKLSNVINFFSSGEDVLRPGNGDLPNLLNEVWHTEEVWVYNEMVKGTNALATTLTGDRQGGWGFNRHYMKWVDPGGPAHPPAGNWEPLPVAEANAIHPDALLKEPFFFPFSSGDSDFPKWENGTWLYSDVGIANTHLPDPESRTPEMDLLKNRAKIIAEAIPAQSPATGAVTLPDVPLLQNIDLDQAYRDATFWPERSQANKRQRWLHSDYINPALPFVHRFYRACVESL
jgi:pimeloyl-ACP methyl ester carboxylesterase